MAKLSRKTRRSIVLLISAYLAIGLVVGLFQLNDRLTSQPNWECPAGIGSSYATDLPIHSTRKLTNECTRTLTFVDGVTLVGTVTILWPIVPFFIFLKGLSRI